MAGNSDQSGLEPSSSLRQINWQVGGGVVLPVCNSDLPSLDLPDSTGADFINRNGKREFHVTLIGRQALVIHGQSLVQMWDEIASEAPSMPRPEFEKVFRVASRGDLKTWYVVIRNQAAFRNRVNSLSALIDQKLKSAGYKCFYNNESHRCFHVSVANNRGGDPFQSIGDISHPIPHE